MKRYSISLVMLLFIAFSATAQISEGGVPLSMLPVYSADAAQQYIPLVSLPAPDINKLRVEDSIYLHNKGQLLRIGMVLKTDIDFQSLGAITTMSDGEQIWRLKISVPGMQALGLYYDHFHLPQGVKYYLYNSNGRQILGAFTADNDPEDGGRWANEKVEGGSVTLEMDIDPGVAIADIKMHIDGICVFYKATSYLKKYEIGGAIYRTTNTYFDPYGSSPCEVNAVCSTGRGFDNQINATVHIEYLNASRTYAYAASGFMVNNTSGDCTPYVLTASHVEPANSTSNTTFAGWIFYYNYQTATCSATDTPASTSTVVGATLAVRSNFDSGDVHHAIDHDYILLDLKRRPPASYHAYLTGWDVTNPGIFSKTGTFMSFHHPGGDIKKVATVSTINPNGNFNGGGVNTHWIIDTWDQGGTEEGSSGSGLFDANGHVLGILSGGQIKSPPCTTKNASGQEMADYALYSKLNYDWTSTGLPSGTLKDYLDPSGTNANTLNGMNACPPNAVNHVSSNINDVRVYPNPSKGIVNIEVPGNPSAVYIAVFNMLGQKQLEVNSAVLKAGTFQLDLSHYPAGVYMVRLAINDKVLTRQVVLAR